MGEACAIFSSGRFLVCGPSQGKRVLLLYLICGGVLTLIILHIIVHVGRYIDIILSPDPLPEIGGSTYKKKHMIADEHTLLYIYIYDENRVWRTFLITYLASVILEYNCY